MPQTLFSGTIVEELSPEKVKIGLDTDLFGREMFSFSTISSTNDLVRQKARAGAPEGLVVLAEEQTAGRGRGNRRWQAPAGGSLLVSLLLRPTFLPPGQAFLLTALAGLAVAEAVEAETALRPALKWPNDLLIEGGKVCGILVELEGQAGRLQWAILGWGLNVNVDFSGDAELAGRATSLATALGRPVPRLPLLQSCLERMDVHYGALRAGRGEDIRLAWRARLETLGRQVEIVAPGEAFPGVALDVDCDGALLVRREDGTVQRVLAGDVTLREVSPRGGRALCCGGTAI